MSNINFKNKNTGFTRTPKFGVTPKGGGFTLIETLVAISIFTSSILALLVMISNSSANSNYARKQIVASYLAQEGIEYMRNMRDTYVLYDATSANEGWKAWNGKVAGGVYPSSSVCANGAGCYFDASQPMMGSNIIACSSPCPAILYEPDNGKFGYVASTKTINSGYTRQITVKQINDNETKIYSTVSWSQSGTNYSLTFSEDVFNWIE